MNIKEQYNKKGVLLLLFFSKKKEKMKKEFFSHLDRESENKYVYFISQSIVCPLLCVCVCV